jgi:hypothetical protein
MAGDREIQHGGIDWRRDRIAMLQARAPGRQGKKRQSGRPAITGAGSLRSHRPAVAKDHIGGLVSPIAAALTPEIPDRPQT